MFLLVPAHPGFPGQIPQSRKTVVLCVCVSDVLLQNKTEVKKHQNNKTFWNCFISQIKQFQNVLVFSFQDLLRHNLHNSNYFYSHYRGQTASAGTSSKDLDDFLETKL